MCILILITTFCNANENNSEENSFDIEIAKAFSQFEFYGMPQRLQTGIFYRKNDFSVYPNVGVFFDSDDYQKLGFSIGNELQYKAFTWSSDIFYDIYPFTVTQPLDEQIVSFENNFIVSFPGGSIEFPNTLARKKMLLKGSDETPVESIINQGVGLNLFLLDHGFLRSSAATLFTLKTVPEKQFFSYEIEFAVPLTFSFYYVDIGIIYEFIHSDELKTKNKPLANYETGNEWEAISGRFSLYPINIRFKTLQAFELEFRWFALRHFLPDQSYFLSLFAQVGWGFEKNNSSTLMYEYGAGFGYILFDVVPFTFQAGVDKNFNPVFKLSVVSKIIHPS